MNNDNDKEKRAGFTPGPWTIRECPQDGHYEGGEDPCTIGAGEKFIASVKLQSHSTQANARLIASAPAMHEVLTELLDTLEVPRGYGFDKEYEKVREVLAKVDGRAEG